MLFAQIVEFVGNHWELVLAFVVILSFLSYDIVVGDQGSVDPSEAVNLINRQDAVVVDVRSPVDFNKGHIVHALNIPMNEITKQMPVLERHKGQPIIMNCDSGSRSATTCGQLRKLGFTQVYNLRGGILAWESAHLPISRKNR